MWKSIVLAAIILIGAFVSLGGIKVLQILALVEAGENFVPPPETVSTAKAQEETWAPQIRSVGTVVAARGVTVSTEVPGLVTKLGFESGVQVRRGTMLVQLDASIERAQLESALATAELAEASLRRARGLAKQNVNAPAELDAAKATARQARAQVENIRAQIAKKTIRAPFSGQLGIRRVELGQILDPGAPIVELQDIRKVYVDFFLPQQDLGRVAADQVLELWADGSDRKWQGKIQTIEPTVDVATRSVRVRGELANEGGALHPGMFVEVRIELPSSKKVIVVPATSVVYAPYGNSIFVIAAGEGQKKGQVARQVFVELGERRGDFISVRSGLTAAQEVVSAGAFKLRDGMSVVVDNSKSLDPQLDPDPSDS